MLSHDRPAYASRLLPFLALLHDAAGGEGACRKNRSRQTDVAKAGVQACMRYCINKTVSISSDPFELLLSSRGWAGDAPDRVMAPWRGRWYNIGILPARRFCESAMNSEKIPKDCGRCGIRAFRDASLGINCERR